MKGVKGILLMAGEGKRFGRSTPKQFHLLGGKPLYLWAFEKMAHSSLFEEIILVCSLDHVEIIEKQIGSNHQVIPGGKTRQESSYKGLLACGPETEIVVIHDAVRPFVTQKILEENVKGARNFGAVDTCIPSSDTIIHSKDGKKIAKIPHREEYFRGQTPQSFSYPLVLESHKHTKHTSASDDCTLVLEHGKKIHIVYGHDSNLKITSPQDLKIAEVLLKNHLKMDEE